MFALPDYWWLLCLAALPQVAFGVVLAIFRGSGTRKHVASDVPKSRVVPVWAIVMLCVGAAIGVGYGIMQRDAVFILGQACILLVALIRNRIAAQENQ